MERRGVPTLTFITDVFAGLAAQVATGLESQLPAHIVVSHAIATAPPETVALTIAVAGPRIRAAVFDDVTIDRPNGSARPARPIATAVERLEHGGDDEEAMDMYRQRGWSDGLPIVLPTEDRVEAMLGTYSGERHQVLGYVAPSGAPLSLEALATVAVMAGCDRSYFPTVVAALEAILMPKFNLLRLQTTTSAGAPMLIVGGPGVADLGINSGGDVLGSYYRANITIGRAVRLAMIGVGGARPQLGDMSTLGQSAKVGLCIAEDIADSPWEPLHVSAGFAAQDNVVSAIGICGQMNINDFTSKTAEGLLRTMAGTIAVPGLYNVQIGGGPLVLLGPDHARLLSSAGLSRRDLQEWLFEHARVPASAFADGMIEAISARRPALRSGADLERGIPIADDPASIVILVAGGSGSHSVLMPVVRDSLVFATVGSHLSG